MDPITTKIIDQTIQILKLIPKHLLVIFHILIAILFTLIVILFAPDKFLFVPGIIEFRGNYEQFLGAALVLVFFLILFVGINPKWQRYKKLAPLKRYLRTLSDDEKYILKRYIDYGKKTQDLREDDGNVTKLAENRVILKGPRARRIKEIYAYTIENWAWDYLNKNKQLLDSTEEVENL